jgi:hypothetical protein
VLGCAPVRGTPLHWGVSSACLLVAAIDWFTPSMIITNDESLLRPPLTFLTADSSSSSGMNTTLTLLSSLDPLLVNVPRSDLFLALFLPSLAIMWLVNLVQLIYDYQLFGTSRVRPPVLKLYIHWWSVIISSFVMVAYLALALLEQPFVFRL